MRQIRIYVCAIIILNILLCGCISKYAPAPANDVISAVKYTFRPHHLMYERKMNRIVPICDPNVVHNIKRLWKGKVLYGPDIIYASEGDWDEQEGTKYEEYIIYRIDEPNMYRVVRFTFFYSEVDGENVVAITWSPNYRMTVILECSDDILNSLRNVLESYRKLWAPPLGGEMM